MKLFFLSFFPSSFLFFSPSLSLFLPFIALFRHNLHLAQPTIYSAQSMVFSICRAGHHEPINFRTFHDPKRNSIPHILPQPPGNQSLIYFLSLWMCFMLDISYQWKHTNMLFCHWLRSLSTVWSRSAPVVMCCNGSLLFFTAEQYSTALSFLVCSLLPVTFAHKIKPQGSSKNPRRKRKIHLL